LPLRESTGLRQLVTIHDLVWKEYGETMRFPGRQIENFFTPRALARADVIVAVSQFTRSRLEYYFPQYARKLRVVPGASMLRGGPTGERESSGDYFLFVGTLEPRKNLPRLLRAYHQFVEAEPAARPLKIAGGSGWGQQDIGRLVADLGLSGRVQLLGKVDDAMLADLYGGAYALLMPSLYEGFGLPVVEALSMGVPVIVSRDSALSEVAGSAGIFVDPQSEREIRQALARISTDQELYRQLRKEAITEAQRYDWNHSATTMAGLLMPC
jgi:glycosyltransferase involved in cell wall biosynthesis